MFVDDRALSTQAARIEALLDEIESFPDPALRAAAGEVVQGLLTLYGEGLTRMLALVAEHGDRAAGDQILEAFARDELVSHLLLLHDLHPVDVETRVARALDEVRPYLQSHGGDVEFLGVEGGVAHLRLQGSCHGCPSSTITLRLAIEEAIQKAAPDLDDIVAEGVAEPPRTAGFVPVTTLRKSPARPASVGPAADGEVAWTPVGGLPALDGGKMAARTVAGQPVLFCPVEETIVAYRNGCPACGHPLDQGVLDGTRLSCPACPHRFDVRRAGRCLDAPDLHLEPIPLLVQDGIVTVAVTSCEL